MRPPFVRSMVTIALLATACSAPQDATTTQLSTVPSSVPTVETESTGDAVAPDLETTTTTLNVAAPAPELSVRSSFGRLTVSEAGSGQPVRLDGVAGVQEQMTAENGTAAWLNLMPGDYTVTVADESFVRTVSAEPAPPPQDLYDNQRLQPGFNYIETRDGTLLSAFVTLPTTAGDVDGRHPTLVEYSGYSPSDPSAQDAARLSLPLLGYALVQVNVRGTGCSGGVYDGFAEIERHDGYDVIETVGAQRWSAGIGMWGVSYPGIMQLHVGAAQPPSLDAIAPLSVIGTIGDTLFPGGIFNNGFGKAWTEQVSAGAEPFGQEWTRTRVDEGDSICAANQSLRIHNPNLVDTALAAPYSTELSRSRSPESFVPDIDVPVFLAGAWQDEQTGGGFVQLLDNFVNAPSFRATLYNGLHIDPLGPDVLIPLLEFYDLYVARRAPEVNPVVGLVVSAGSQSFFGESLEAPTPELAGLSYEEALAAYEQADPIRVLYEVGAERPGLPVARFAQTFEQWPVTDTVLGLSLSPAGVLEPAGPESGDSPVAQFTSDPGEGSELTLSDRAATWTAQPGWNWPEADRSNRATFTAEPFDTTTPLTGSASATMRLRLPDGDADADIEITLSDIAPDGSETLIQSGWLRLSRRATSASSTPLNPRITNLEADISPLADNEVVTVSVATLAFAHVFRPGHRVSLTVDTPGASRAEWAFDVIPDPVRIEILDGELLLPVVALEKFDTPIPAESPPCGSLRAQPCRTG